MLTSFHPLTVQSAGSGAFQPAGGKTGCGRWGSAGKQLDDQLQYKPYMRLCYIWTTHFAPSFTTCAAAGFQQYDRAGYRRSPAAGDTQGARKSTVIILFAADVFPCCSARLPSRPFPSHLILPLHSQDCSNGIRLCACLAELMAADYQSSGAWNAYHYPLRA